MLIILVNYNLDRHKRSLRIIPLYASVQNSKFSICQHFVDSNTFAEDPIKNQMALAYRINAFEPSYVQ